MRVSIFCCFLFCFCLKYLYEELQKLRPNLVKLANEADDNDESIGDIIKTNEQCEKIINQYRLTFLNERGGAMHQQDDKLVNIMEDASGGGGGDFSSLETVGSMNSMGETGKPAKYDPLKELHDLFSHEPVQPAQPPPGYLKNDLSEFLSISGGGGVSGGGDTTTRNIENLLSSISVSGQAKPTDVLKS